MGLIETAGLPKYHTDIDAIRLFFDQNPTGKEVYKYIKTSSSGCKSLFRVDNEPPKLCRQICAIIGKTLNQRRLLAAEKEPT